MIDIDDIWDDEEDMAQYTIPRQNDPRKVARDDMSSDMMRAKMELADAEAGALRQRFRRTNMTKIEEIAHAIRQLTYAEMLEFAEAIATLADMRGLSIGQSREDTADVIDTVCFEIVKATEVEPT